MPDFGANLQRLMVRLDLTIEEVGARTGLDERTVKSLLQGRNKPHSRTLHRLVDGLAVSAEELFQNPGLLAWRVSAFDRATNPAVEEFLASQPEAVADWSEAEFAELYSRFGEGGALTMEGAREAVAAMNRRREVQQKVAVLLETDQAELLAGLIDLLYQKVLVPAD
ncbi:MAG TPA: helix-turn-helix transcriptional regulator [Pirellulales bacterium]|nr:helix-turn-helix transcriptional regulator [Pirellulales bacterium]